MNKLEQERQRSEQLLYRMMPKVVADRLRDGQKAIETCEVLWEVVCALMAFVLHRVVY